MKKAPPFYPNTADDTHCYQAALRMVLKHFKPEEEYTWEELEKLTAKVEGLWTWPTQGLINLYSMGFEVIDVDDFNIEQFIEQGGEYLIKKYGKEVGELQINHSDIAQEQRIFSEYLELKIHQERLPTLEEIKRYLDEDFLVGCNVNAYMLENEEGYAGHFVVLYDYDKEGFLLHDPGLPPQPERKISFEQFCKAWEYPDKSSRNLQAFRLP
jgi:hypothetical protein